MHEHTAHLHTPWHRRLAHFNARRIKAADGRSTGIDFTLFKPHSHDPTQCQACMINSRRHSHRRRSEAQRTGARRFSFFGERISSDLCEMVVSIPHGYKYFIIFVDHASTYLHIQFLTDKLPHHVLQALKHFIIAHRIQLSHTGGFIEWHTDNGGEFSSQDIEEFCMHICTKHTTIVPYTPQDNGLAERMIGVVCRQARILLADANLTDSLWPYAINQVSLVHNSLPSSGLAFKVSAYEFVNHKKPNLEIFKVFGCKCYVHASMPCILDGMRASEHTLCM